jgi:hypothetical protein
MLYKEIIAVCFEIHTKHINTLCWQNVEFLNIKPGGTYIDHWVLKTQVIERLVLQQDMVALLSVQLPKT